MPISMKTADLEHGDTVFQTVRAAVPTAHLDADATVSGGRGETPFIRHIVVTAIEQGTVVHGPGTIRVLRFTGTDSATGQTVRWTSPRSQWRAAYRPQPPKPVQEFLPQGDPSGLDVIQRMLASVGR